VKTLHLALQYDFVDLDKTVRQRTPVGGREHARAVT
jgi:hypothetical protein